MKQIEGISFKPTERIVKNFNDYVITFNIHKKNNQKESTEELYTVLQKFYSEDEIIFYLIDQINSLNKIIFEVLKYVNITDDKSFDLINKELLKQWEHGGFTKKQSQEFLKTKLGEEKNIENSLDYEIFEEIL